MNLSIDNISFSYPETRALKRICCSLHQGDMAVIIGPNGSGKSTLLKCIDKILHYQDGHINLDNDEIKDISMDALSRRIAYVPQREQNILPMSVFDTVLLGRKPHIKWNVTDRDLHIVSRMLESLGLSELAIRDMNTLSGGQQQRVTLARALCQEPDILLLDEPTANLDLYHQTEIMDRLSQLSQDGMIVILTLHDINLAAQYGTKFLMLHEGSLFANGGKEVFTEENIETLFNTPVEIIRNGEDLYILPQKRIKHHNRS